MTRKEAIKWLVAIKDKYIRGGDDGFDNKRREAIDTAIKSFEAWDELKEKIETYKSLLYPEDVDFFRGQISALSAVQCFVEQSLYEVVGCQEKKQQN